MGVKGLWHLLEPTGRPVTLESLEGKVLAVDASIWLNQTVKGMRDRHGNALPNAHLIGLFHRVCKLLFYRIKPVFVFDGATPALKKQTLAERRQRKEAASEASERATRRLVEGLLKQHALRAVLHPEEAARDAWARVPGNATAGDKREDMFDLPPEPDRERMDRDVADDSAWEERMSQRDAIYKQFGNLEKIDLESEEFLSLPPEVRHEILTELKDERKRNHWSTMHQMPQEADNFSDFQVERLMKKSHLSRKIESVRKELNAGSTADVTASLAGDSDYTEAHAQRIVSEDTGHFILIKGLSKRHQVERAQDLISGKEPPVKSESGQSDQNAVESTTRDASVVEDDVKPSTSGYDPKSEANASRNDLQFSSDDDDVKVIKDVPVKRSSRKGRTSSNPTKRLKRDVVDMQSSSGSDSESDGVEKFSSSKRTKRFTQSADVEKTEALEPNDLRESQLLKSQQETRAAENTDGTSVDKEDAAQDFHGMPMRDAKKSLTAAEERDTGSGEAVDTAQTDAESSAAPAPSDVHLEAQNIGSVFMSHVSASQLKPVTLPRSGVTETKPDATAATVTGADKDDVSSHSSSDSEDEGFIEITIDPNNVQPDDELFPASIFEPAMAPPGGRSEKQATPTLTSLTEKDEEGAPSEVETEVDAVRMDSEEQQQLQKAIEESLAESARQSENDSGAEVTERVDDPRSAFEGLSREELLEVRDALDAETPQLLQSRGQMERVAASITEQMALEAQDLLRLFGVPFVVSPGEAEAQCAFLDATGQTSGTVTDDSDVWLFGGVTVYKNFFNQNRHLELFRSREIEQKLMLDRERMIALALLCGSDYTPGVAGVGPVTALEVLAEFPGDGIEPLVSLKRWWDAAQKQKKPAAETKLKSRLRQVVLWDGFPNPAIAHAYTDPDVDTSRDPFTWAKPDIPLLKDYARDKLGWTREKIDETLQPVMKSLQKSGTQARITSFMMSTAVGEPAGVKSKRVKQTLTRMRAAQREADATAAAASSDAKPPKEKAKDILERGTKEAALTPTKSLKSEIQNKCGANRGTMPTTRPITSTGSKNSSRKKGAGARSGRGKGTRGRGRGRVPVVPEEVVLPRSESTRRRDAGQVNLSESGSSSESGDEGENTLSGGFL